MKESTVLVIYCCGKKIPQLIDLNTEVRDPGASLLRSSWGCSQGVSWGCGPIWRLNWGREDLLPSSFTWLLSGTGFSTGLPHTSQLMSLRVGDPRHSETEQPRWKLQCFFITYFQKWHLPFDSIPLFRSKSASETREGEYTRAWILEVGSLQGAGGGGKKNLRTVSGEIY
jgi:hypothetical protein